MEIIAVIAFIVIVISVEVQIYKTMVLPNVEYDCFFSKKEVLEGETLEIVETVINPSPFWVPCMKSEITTSKYLAFAENVSTTNDKSRSLASLFDIKSKQKVRRAWKAKCLKRKIIDEQRHLILLFQNVVEQ